LWLSSYKEFNFISNNFNINNKVATHGRILFYDNHLSLNNSVSCASCHKQQFAFADNSALSTGFANVKTLRNTPPIQNIRFNNFSATKPLISGEQNLFWDGREKNLNKLAFAPIANHIEMGITDYIKLAIKLNELPYYKSLSKSAFGQDELTPINISIALAQFCASIRAVNSRVDREELNFNNAETNLSALENAGKNLFIGAKYNCVSCHTSVLAAGSILGGGGVYNSFTNNGTPIKITANIGLDLVDKDKGIQNISLHKLDEGVFKIPDLHNVALTAPYMHDGHFKTLEEVLNHYSKGINQNANLDERLKNSNGTPKKLDINEADKKAIIAFLKALTDNQTITEPAYSNPFSN
jgi:cytochrome c peroxidase